MSRSEYRVICFCFLLLAILDRRCSPFTPLSKDDIVNGALWPTARSDSGGTCVGYSCPIFPDVFPNDPATSPRSSTIIKKSSKNITEEFSKRRQKIPRYMWITAPNITYVAYDFEQVENALQTNANWTLLLADDDTIDSFFEYYFKGTSLLWAYQNIDRQFGGAARTDIWRYAVLYVHGGLYIDSDSAYWGEIDREFIREDDELIIAPERNRFDSSFCYHDSSKFSPQTLSRHHDSTILNSSPYYPKPNVVLNWLIVSAPRHIAMRKVLENFVYVMRMEYLGFPVLAPGISYHNRVLCLTGPLLLTASMEDAYLAVKEGLINVSSSTPPPPQSSSSSSSSSSIPASPQYTSIRSGSRDFHGEHASFKFLNINNNKDYRKAPRLHSILVNYANETESVAAMNAIFSSGLYNFTTPNPGIHVRERHRSHRKHRFAITSLINKSNLRHTNASEEKLMEADEHYRSPVYYLSNGFKRCVFISSNEAHFRAQAIHHNITENVWTLPVSVLESFPEDKTNTTCYSS